MGKPNAFRRKVLGSDEAKIEIFDHNDNTNV